MLIFRDLIQTDQRKRGFISLTYQEFLILKVRAGPYVATSCVTRARLLSNIRMAHDVSEEYLPRSFSRWKSTDTPFTRNLKDV